IRIVDSADPTDETICEPAIDEIEHIFYAKPGGASGGAATGDGQMIIVTPDVKIDLNLMSMTWLRDASFWREPGESDDEDDKRFIEIGGPIPDEFWLRQFRAHG